MQISAITGVISYKVDTIIEEDGVEIARSCRRGSVVPLLDHKNQDLNALPPMIKIVADSIWTDEIIEKFKNSLIEDVPEVIETEEE